MADAKPSDLIEGPFALVVGITAALGIMFGTVGFAMTRNPIWLAVGILIGAGLGIAVWTVRQAIRR